MLEFNAIAGRVKETIVGEGISTKVLDKDIAAALNLDPQYYAVIKRRNKIPYENIAIFCKEKRVCMNWILLDQEPKYI